MVLHLRPRVEHIWYRRSMPAVPPPLDFNSMPFVYPLVAALRLVFALKQRDLRYLAAASPWSLSQCPRHRPAIESRLRDMYIRIRSIAGGVSMTCKDCGHAISVNKICERPIQAATDMLKHMAAHNASRAFAVAACVMATEPEALIAVEPIPALPEVPWVTSIPQSPN